MAPVNACVFASSPYSSYSSFIVTFDKGFPIVMKEIKNKNKK